MTDAHGNRNGFPQSYGDAPAFPVSLPGVGDNGWHGMSLRDWFAGQALTGLLHTTEAGSAWKAVAIEAYLMADAMLAQRSLPQDE